VILPSHELNASCKLRLALVPWFTYVGTNLSRFNMSIVFTINYFFSDRDDVFIDNEMFVMTS
jgi:hypothetical protein